MCFGRLPYAISVVKQYISCTIADHHSREDTQNCISGLH